MAALLRRHPALGADLELLAEGLTSEWQGQGRGKGKRAAQRAGKDVRERRDEEEGWWWGSFRHPTASTRAHRVVPPLALLFSGGGFKPRADEELLAALSALHAKALLLTRAASSDALPLPLVTMLRRLHKRFFLGSTSTAAPQEQEPQPGAASSHKGPAAGGKGKGKKGASPKAAAAEAAEAAAEAATEGAASQPPRPRGPLGSGLGLGALRGAFERDFLALPHGAGDPAAASAAAAAAATLTVGEALERLARWKAALARRVRSPHGGGEGGGGRRPMGALSPALGAFRRDQTGAAFGGTAVGGAASDQHAVEVPGQYLASPSRSASPRPHLHAKVGGHLPFLHAKVGGHLP
jgi:hypothetical protein